MCCSLHFSVQRNGKYCMHLKSSSGPINVLVLNADRTIATPTNLASSVTVPTDLALSSDLTTPTPVHDSVMSMPPSSAQSTDIAGLMLLTHQDGVTSTSCAPASSAMDIQPGHAPLTIEELLQNVVEANPDVFPNNAQHAVDNGIQNGCGNVVDSLPSNAVVDGGVVLSDAVDFSELGGECGSVSSNAVLATLRSLVEVMNGTGIPEVAQSTDQIEVWPPTPQGDGKRDFGVVFNFHLTFPFL